MQLPQEYLQKMQNLLAKDYSKYIDAMQKPAVSAMRINPLKSNKNVIGAFSVVKKIDYADNGYIISSGKIGKHPYHIAGAVYVQEPSSMLPVIASDLTSEPSKANLTILDLCAAPGGKSGQIAEILAGDGVLVSNEIDKRRAHVLQGNIERMGYQNVIITCASPQELSRDLANQFDYIFVDAPCGGEGMFRKDSATICEWQPQRILSNQKRQKEILVEANKMLKTGGKLIYSTCTFAKEEDEDVAVWFAQEYGYKLLSVPQSVQQATTYLSHKECRRFYPFLSDGEGQFVCVMQKQSPANNQIRPYRLFDVGRTEQQILNDFITNNFELEQKPKFTKIGQNYCIINQKLAQILPFLQKLPVVNAGITIGTIDKNRLILHNNIFSALGHLAKNKLNFQVNDANLAKYLHGEVLPNDNNFSGYVCIMADNLAIGGAKATGGELKNLYPKGLRI